MKPSVYIIYPGTPLRGGSAGMAAWSIVSLRDSFRVFVIGYSDWPAPSMNDYHGTDLRESDFAVIRPFRARWANRCAASLPRTLSHSLVASFVKRRVSDGLCLSLCGEFDFGRIGIQFVYYPFYSDGSVSTYERAGIGCRDTALRRAYRRLCYAAYGRSIDSIRRNLTLGISQYTVEEIRRAYGIDATVLNPPVLTDGFPEVPWNRRGNDFVMLGRMVPYKNHLAGIEAVARLRAMGHECALHIVGSWGGHAGYNRRLRALAAERPWIRLHTDLSRARLMEVVTTCRYGIHGMAGEHFGMAIVELMAAGCIPFVPDQGGAPEIVGERRGLLAYRSGDLDDLVARVVPVLSDEALQRDLSEYVRAKAGAYRASEYCRKLRDLALSFDRTRRADACRRASSQTGSAGAEQDDGARTDRSGRSPRVGETLSRRAPGAAW